MSAIVDSPFVKGTWVMIEDETGVFRVMRNHLNADGSLMLYGGDKSRYGRRGFRAVMPDRLVETTNPNPERSGWGASPGEEEE